MSKFKFMAGLLILMSQAVASASTILKIVPSETVVASDSANTVESFFDVFVQVTDGTIDLASYNAMLHLTPGDVGVEFISVEAEPTNPAFPGQEPDLFSMTGPLLQVGDILSDVNAFVTISGEVGLFRVRFQAQPNTMANVSVTFDVDNTQLFDPSFAFIPIDSRVGGTINIIPEPGTLSLLGMGVLIFARVRRSAWCRPYGSSFQTKV